MEEHAVCVSQRWYHCMMVKSCKIKTWSHLTIASETQKLAYNTMEAFYKIPAGLVQYMLHMEEVVHILREIPILFLCYMHLVINVSQAKITIQIIP